MNKAAILQPGWTDSIRQVNGLSLHVVEAGPADGPLLILLHGFPEFWWAWRHQITPLAEGGFRVVASDLRGYNLSDKPKGMSAYRLDLLAADVLALADSYGADRFRLVGHDWGGVVAWSVAARRPDRVDRLVIMDAPHPDILTSQALKHPLQALRSFYVALFQLPWLPETALAAFDFAALRRAMKASARRDTFEPGSLDSYAQAWAHPGSLTAMLNYYRALRGPRVGEPARIAPPTLILWGERDSFLREHVARASLDLCDDGRLTIVAGATHWLHLEEPRRVNAEIIAFLSHNRAPG
jgi:pimeloyl-ACP methyl ester carboxylesterase